MLEQIELGKRLEKEEFKSMMDTLTVKLGELQRKLRNYNIPVAILFEGWEASGKGTLINHLIHPLDPRGFKVFTMEEKTEEEKWHSFFWAFWNQIPAKGRIHIYDHSWYHRMISEKIYKHPEDMEAMLDEFNLFEKQLTDDGVVLIKFFLHISKKEQESRFEKLEKSEDTSWRVNKEDWKENKKYHDYLEVLDRVLIQTDTPNAPWYVIEATDKKYAIAKMFHTVIKQMSKALDLAEHKTEKQKEQVENQDKPENFFENKFKPGVLKGIDLSVTMEKEKYKEKLEKLQDRLRILHNRMYRERVPVIIALEGWDAAGKGGAIKRITENIDPRGYEVIPISAPNDLERQYHYLWRFWTKFPKAGHLEIFDRTWYGRVLVERVEGFATREQWSRAYNEINQMEENLVQDGYIILKFWLHISKEEQEKRFHERENIVEKQWKITEEDWRNRSKWEQYEEAVDEMIVKTSTSKAPWVIVEADSKLYARIKILETIVETLENILK
ncbi:polyphosphate:AMP phosphotransferase [Anaeromicropila populeti]|uniref:Polyphosphate:AMP phosphotransferase n=1 Tax=Anaeromicropila populeti TaxID=37658 RepID=A0A1I6K6G0_9FIRM|nr:polyphosphate:AMP phosphotransferase [Anaeromicropila populeti]SFR86812.1 polyphosphate:AMP phosphotransferase [Anaeromicropila populeti]